MNDIFNILKFWGNTLQSKYCLIKKIAYNGTTYTQDLILDSTYELMFAIIRTSLNEEKLQYILYITIQLFTFPHWNSKLFAHDNDRDSMLSFYKQWNTNVKLETSPIDKRIFKHRYAEEVWRAIQT